MSSTDMKEMQIALRATASAVQTARACVMRMANLMAYLVSARAKCKAGKIKTVFEMVASKQAAHEDETNDRFWLMLQASVLGLDEKYQPIEGKRGLLEKLGNWTHKNGLSRPEDAMSLCDFSGHEIDFEMVLKAIFNACRSTTVIEKCVVCLHATVQRLVRMELSVEEEQTLRESDDEDGDDTRRSTRKKKQKKKTKRQLKLEEVEGIADKQMELLFEYLKKDQLFRVDIQRIENENIRKRKSTSSHTAAETPADKKSRVDVKQEAPIVAKVEPAKE